jgi:hypothetical protein
MAFTEDAAYDAGEIHPLDDNASVSVRPALAEVQPRSANRPAPRPAGGKPGQGRRLRSSQVDLQAVHGVFRID